MTEHDFINHVAGRLGRSVPLAEAPVREVIGAPEFWLDYQLASDHRIDKFKTELEKLGGQVDVFESVFALRQGIMDRLALLGPGRIGTWNGVSNEFGLLPALQGYEVVVWGGATDEKDSSGSTNKSASRVVDAIHDFASADVGITGCDYAVADTGTVVLMCDEHKGRSVSLLPSIHIVIVKEHQIRTRIGEVLSELSNRQASGQNQPSSVNFISGPSRSSDIENDLSIGVHGPAAVIAMVLKE